MKREEKEVIVSDLAAKLKDHQFVYFADASGLSAASTNGFRRELHKRGIVMQVAKNTLIRKAMEQSGNNYGDLVNILKGSSAVMFSADAKGPAQAIKAFRKDKEVKPALKGAYIDTDVFVGDDQLDVLLKLKSKQELIGEIIGLLQSPATNVISALKSSGGKLAGIVKTLSERPE